MTKARAPSRRNPSAARPFPAIPGVYLFFGINKEGAGPDEIYTNHSDRFRVNESCLKVGVETHVRLAMSHLSRVARR